MKGSSSRRRLVSGKVRLAAAVVVGGIVGSSAWGQTTTTAYWLGPVSGSWSDGTKWSTAPNFPSNTAGVDFEAVLNATGAAYTVSAYPSYPVGRLTLDSPDVLLQGGVTAREVEVRRGTWWLINGARVADARITIGPEGRIDVAGSPGPAFSNVTLASDLTLYSSALSVEGSLTLDHATLRLDGSSWMTGGDLRGQGRLVFGSDSVGRFAAANVVEPGIELVVEGGKQVAIGWPEARTNFVNQGTITVNAGGALGIYSGGNWANQGTIALGEGATLYADGFASLSGLGAVNRSAGAAVVWNPTVNAPGTVLDLNVGPQGPWELGRANLTGVTVKADGRTAGVYGAGPGPINPAPAGVLTGVTLAADLDFRAGAAFTVRNGLTLADHAVHFKDASAYLNFYQVGADGTTPVAQTLGGRGEIVFDAPGGLNVSTGAAFGSALDTDSTLTVGPDVTLRTGTGDGKVGVRKLDGTYRTVINQGTLSARGAGRTITIDANLVNDGVIEAAEGGVIGLVAPFTNRATIRVTDATVRVTGTMTRETFDPITTSNATAEIAGVFDNTGRTVDVRDGARGVTLALGWGGSIKGGTVTSADGTPLRVVGDAYVVDPVIDAPLLVAPGGALTVYATARVNAGITLDGGKLTLSGTPARAMAVTAKPGSSVLAYGTIKTPATLQSMTGWTLDGARVTFQDYQLTTALVRQATATNSTISLGSRTVLNNGGDTIVTGGSGLTWGVAGGKITGGRIEGATAGTVLSADYGTLENVTAAVSIRNGTNVASSPLTIAGTFAMEPNGSAPVSMTVDGQVSFASGSVSTLKGILTGNGTASLGTNARVTAQGVRTGVSATPGAVLTLMPSAQGGGLSHIKGLNLAQGGTTFGATMDVADVPVIVDFFSSPRQAVASGYAGGTWGGKGVTSSYAATHPGTAIGWAYAFDLLGSTQNPAGTILGETVGPSAAYLRLTQAGDANLDGVVNFDDLLKLAKSYGQTSSSVWFKGDFNYDGTTNFDDLLILAKNYGGARPGAPWTLDSPAPGFAADVAAAFDQVAAVPEPGALGGAACLGGAMMMRRGRRRGAGR